MRTLLLVLMLMFCLPLKWASASAGDPCVQQPCASMHASMDSTPSPTDRDEHTSESHAQHLHCASCHIGDLVQVACMPFFVSDNGARAISSALAWTEGIFVERPERPQWSALA